MIASMTGFGRAKKESNTFYVQAELKSVNHRFCEINVRLPRQLLFLEDKIKKAIGEHVKRGRVEVFLTIEGEGLVTKTISIDWNLLDALVTSTKQIQDKYQLTEQITTGQLLSNENILSIEEKEMENQELETLILEVIESAALQLRQMREVEGKALIEDIFLFLGQIEENIHTIKVYAPRVVSHYRDRIEKRIKEYIGNEFDENRILTEVALFAEKADISEELTRLESHISQFRETVQTNEPIGRKLDFIVQEMNREINTIGSKANDSLIAKHVVDLKSLLEKIKEQVQNIE
ncbi:YicC/YloC family endoribonuclease [Fredinandcohnia sp. QZ13]|uniref:YicC/YloC family endoribonuclease n=1 Tax=Fredinandcohnia sp. QZ13 TaxID=3073144 RepID=UPI0028530755|nr:YicC/YloC family endoribonuclease [Fredinandcohnia sp. QZ13]MDR4886555.1 YicC/YloC family endoribonuclease [Fredinandcohnia sp. QZ13]